MKRIIKKLQKIYVDIKIKLMLMKVSTKVGFILVYWLFCVYVLQLPNSNVVYCATETEVRSTHFSALNLLYELEPTFIIFAGLVIGLVSYTKYNDLMILKDQESTYSSVKSLYTGDFLQKLSNDQSLVAQRLVDSGLDMEDPTFHNDIFSLIQELLTVRKNICMLCIENIGIENKTQEFNSMSSDLLLNLSAYLRFFLRDTSIPTSHIDESVDYKQTFVESYVAIQQIIEERTAEDPFDLPYIDLNTILDSDRGFECSYGEPDFAPEDILDLLRQLHTEIQTNEKYGFENDFFELNSNTSSETSSEGSCDSFIPTETHLDLFSTPNFFIGIGMGGVSLALAGATLYYYQSKSK